MRHKKLVSWCGRTSCRELSAHSLWLTQGLVHQRHSAKLELNNKTWRGGWQQRWPPPPPSCPHTQSALCSLAIHPLSPRTCTSIFPEITHCLAQLNTAGGACERMCVCMVNRGWGLWFCPDTSWTWEMRFLTATVALRMWQVKERNQ